MANLQESYEWQNAIHELDEGFMQGGPEGIDNVPPRQLSGRTQFLAVLDLLIGDTASMGSKELLKTIQNRMQEGIVTIYNRGVITGCNGSKAATGRKVVIAHGGIFLGGRALSFSGDQNGITIPINNISSTQTYYGYLSVAANGSISFCITEAGSVVPPDGISVCRITVPAGNTATDLAGVTVTDTRRTEAGYPLLVNSLPYVSVALKTSMLDTNYAVFMDVISSAGINQQANIYAADKATNGFKIYVDGTVDAVNVRWFAVKLSL